MYHIQKGMDVFTAAYSGNLPRVQELIASGANVNAEQDNGATPLYFASQEGHTGIVNALIAAGANVNAARNIGATPLFVASHGGHAEIVNALIAAGANMNAAMNDGATPLYIASQRGHTEIVNALIAADANVNAARNDDATPLFIAAFQNHKEIVNALIAAGANVNAARNSGATPLYIASLEGHDIIVNALIAAGANVNAATNDGATPLFIASHEGHAEIVNALIAAGANANAAMNNGATPLYIASQEGHAEIVNALIAAGANVNAAMNDGWTPLFMASQKGHTEIVNALIAADANVNAAMNNGATPLYIASQKGHTVIVNALIAAGADINMPSYEGKSVLQYAREGRFSHEINSLFFESNLEIVKWTGFTKSDIERLDTIFDTDAAPGMRPNAENWSMCPVCLKFAVRTSGCKYMHHNCSLEGGYKHNDLYDKYKNESGNIFWCTICNRICSGHRHYRIHPWNTTTPELVPTQTGVNFFSADCTGNEGGGGLLEKLVRFRRFKQYARELQADVGKISFSDAMNQLVEEMWNAPLARFRGAKNMMTLKKFNVPNNNFLANVSVATNNTRNAPNLVRPNSNTLRPIVKTIGVNADAENSVGYAEEGRVIYFIHRKPDGAVVNHETNGEGIGESSLKRLIRDYNANFGLGNFGKCPFDCGALLFPDEVRDIIPAEDYETYRKHFNKKFRAAAGAGAAGGTRIGKYRRTRKQKGGDGKNILVEAKFTQCSIVGGRRKTRKMMKSRKVLKYRK